MPGTQLFLEGEARPLTISEATPVADGPGWWLGFREVSSRNGAERLRERYLEVEVDRATDLEPGQAYWHEIVGSEVLDRAGRSLGHVVDIYRAGESEVYVVRGDAHGEFDVPAVRSIVTDFAPEQGRITVDEAALDLDAAPVDAPSKRPRRAHAWSRHGKGARSAPTAAPSEPGEAP